jgi:hypothetical protein
MDISRREVKKFIRAETVLKVVWSGVGVSLNPTSGHELAVMKAGLVP